jgi:hypothetical protein
MKLCGGIADDYAAPLARKAKGKSEDGRSTARVLTFAF